MESDIVYRLARIDVLKIGKLGIIFNRWAHRYATPTIKEACNSYVRAQCMCVNLGGSNIECTLIITPYKLPTTRIFVETQPPFLLLIICNNQ